VFRYLQGAGRIADDEMLRTFNMGIGMIVVVPAHRESEVRAHLTSVREPHWRVGAIVPGARKVIFARDAAGPADWTAARA
jgi:phosphoribosylformylglycinamidine cyclo-ligase